MTSLAAPKSPRYWTPEQDAVLLTTSDDDEAAAFTVAFKTHPAHRIAFWSATGIDPGGLMVCHRCDNPPCCNPAHLFLGTHTENVHDMLAKGRTNPPRGERHHGAKLTAEQVREIRTRRAAGETLVDLGREFGVGGARLSVIVNHPDKAWSHV
jgi:hypothetical protein